MRRLIAAALIVLAGSAFAGPLPPDGAPGAVRDDLNAEQICSKKWGKDRRHVTAAMKREVFTRDGLSSPSDPSCKLDKHGRRFEVDHRVPRELGGADDVKNLWAQCYSGQWNAVMKDRLENLIHKKVCAGELALKDGQAVFLGDWTDGYRQHLGE